MSRITVAEMGRHERYLQELEDVFLAGCPVRPGVVLADEASRMELEAPVLCQQAQVSLELPTACPPKHGCPVGLVRAEDDVHSPMPSLADDSGDGWEEYDFGDVQMTEDCLEGGRWRSDIDDVRDERLLLKLPQELFHAGDLRVDAGGVGIGYNDVDVIGLQFASTKAATDGVETAGADGVELGLDLQRMHCSFSICYGQSSLAQTHNLRNLQHLRSWNLASKVWQDSEAVLDV